MISCEGLKSKDESLKMKDESLKMKDEIWKNTASPVKSHGLVTLERRVNLNKRVVSHWRAN